MVKVGQAQLGYLIRKEGKTMEYFINFVIDLANEELYEYLDGDAKSYFLQGGCFEFAKIIKGYIKSSQIVINKDYEHCGILHEGNIYDATGKVKERNQFLKANQKDIEYMENRFGIPEKQYIKGKRISDYLIEEIKQCNIESLIERIEGEER